jgi:hypothetical protein
MTILTDKDIEEIFGTNPKDCRKEPIVRLLLNDNIDHATFVEVPAKTIVKEIEKRILAKGYTNEQTWQKFTEVKPSRDMVIILKRKGYLTVIVEYDHFYNALQDRVTLDPITKDLDIAYWTPCPE